MEHFSIIQAICRAALATPTPALIKQVERLKKALEKESQVQQVKALESLISSTEGLNEMAPSKINRSFLSLGQELTMNTPIPVDKETSIPLAEIIYPALLPKDPPIIDEEVQFGVNALLEEWKNFESLELIDAHPSRSCLFFGAPGTGKTHLAMWVARELGLPIVLAKLDGLMSSFLGTTARNIGQLFSFAAKYRCVLLLDEFDAIAKQRDDPQEVGEIKRVVNTLLQNLDARRDLGFTIGITNHQLLLDPAIWRRFEVQVEIPRPSRMIIPQLLEKFLSPLTYQKDEIKLMTWVLDGSTGADINAFSQWMKKMKVIAPGRSLVQHIRSFSVLNASRIDEEKRAVLLKEDEDWIEALIDDRNFKFIQKEVAYLLGTSTSTVSRIISNK